MTFLSSTGNLNSYIDQQLKPNEPFNARMSQAMDRLAAFIREHPNLSIAKVVKSGSMGKGTAVRNMADIDIVVFPNDIKDVQQLESRRGMKLQEIEGYFRGMRSDDLQITVRERNYYVLKLDAGLRGSSETIPIDLLVGINYIADMRDLYRVMNTQNAAQYSTSLAQLQCAFVGKQPANVKDLIRLVKHWNADNIRANTRGPTSYAMELVTIHEWENAGRPGSFKTDGAFKKIMTSLQNSRMIDAAWSDNYNPGQYRGQVARDRNKPFLLDPANPFVNVADRYDWDTVTHRAGQALLSVRLQNVNAGF